MKKFFFYVRQQLEGLTVTLPLSLVVLLCAVAISHVTKSWPVAHADTARSTLSATSPASTALEASSGVSDDSETSNTTSTSGTVPAIPTDLTASPGACGTNSMYLRWQPVGTADGYRIYRSDALIYTTKDDNYGDTGLATATNYSYTVYAYNTYGSSKGASVSGVTAGACANTTATTAQTVRSGSGTASDKTPSTSPTSSGTVTGTTATTLQRPSTAASSSAMTAPVPAAPPKRESSTTTPTNIIVSSVTPQAIPQATAEVSSTDLSKQIEDVGLAVEQVKTAADETKVELTKIVTNTVDSIIANHQSAGREVGTQKLHAARDALLQKINDNPLMLAEGTSADITRLQTDVTVGIDAIQTLAGKESLPQTAVSTSSAQIANTLNTLAATVRNHSATLKEQGADLLYKDSNKDGISDYDSIHIYHLDPLKPSPVSTYEGREITASEKIVLRFDPAQRELVKMAVEEPASSTAPTVSAYKVDKVALTADNEVVITGHALPNSFVTVFIYSTPIMVTVKTDSQGEWQYTLDKELESGNHTIYTATVNNAGNIVAKSPGYLFTRTAEAKTLTNAPVVLETDTQKPGLFGGDTFYLIGGVVSGGIVILGLMLILAGRGKREELPIPPPDTTGEPQ